MVKFRRVSLMVGAALLLGLVLPAGAGADDSSPDSWVDANLTYLTQWGSLGSGNGQFNSPYRVAVDGSGNVYVTDQANHRVQKFDAYGTYLTQWGGGGSGNGQFSAPSGVAVDGSGNVYVADYYNHRVQKFDAYGGYLTQWGSNGTGNGQFDIPVGVAVDGSGNVYVTDSHNHRVQKFDANGTYLTQWGSNGTGNSQFKYPWGVAVDESGNVYVTDFDNDRVQKFDAYGTYHTQWGSYGTGNGQFNQPRGVAVDGSGNVYVTEDGNHRVQQFDPNGTYLTQWGSNGSGNSQFNIPMGVAVGGSGDVYVTDISNNRVQKFAADQVTFGRVGVGTSAPVAPLDIRAAAGNIGPGNAVFKIANPAGPTAFQLDPGNDGTFWNISASADNNEFRFSRSGTGGVEIRLTAAGNMTLRGTLTTAGPTCAGGCDAVFDDGYPLLSLEDHATQMWADGYLPAVGPTVPGAPLDLSEMVGLLLNELETAHIYIDQLDARYADQEQRRIRLEASLEESRAGGQCALPSRRAPAGGCQ